MLLLMANILPRAFPPMVSPETRAVTARETATDRMDRACCKRVTMMAAVEPEIMPQMSPTTSLQKLETLLAFRMRPRASRAPGVRWAAMEWKGRSSAADTILGYRYAVAMPEKGLDKINVRIDGKQLMEAPDGYVEVRFDNLEVFIYWSQGQPQVGAKATGIHLVNVKT